MSVSQVKAVLPYVIQTFVHVSAALAFALRYLELLECDLRAGLRRKIKTTVLLREAKYSTLSSINKYLHYRSPELCQASVASPQNVVKTARGQ